LKGYSGEGTCSLVANPQTGTAMHVSMLLVYLT
jgi:hypothetical protein